MLISLFAIALRQFTGAPNAQVSFLTDSQTNLSVSQTSSSSFDGDHFKAAEKSKSPVASKGLSKKETITEE